MLWISLTAAFFVFCVFMWVRVVYLAGDDDVKARLQAISAVEDKEGIDIIKAELQQPFSQRIIRPILQRLVNIFNKMLPVHILDNIQPRLIQAGNPGDLSAGEYFILKALALIALILSSLPLLIVGKSSLFFLLLCGGGLVVWIGPDLYLKNLSKTRVKVIEKSMPDILDLLTVSVEAGYGWDGALQKVTDKRKGPLAKELRRVLHDVKMGKPRRDALRDMSGRLNVDAVTTFVTAVIQADQLGLSLGHVLRTQADQIRHKRRQEVEEEALKAPIKILFPLILFIFPVVFIILLGPAVVQMMETFIR